MNSSLQIESSEYIQTLAVRSPPIGILSGFD